MLAWRELKVSKISWTVFMTWKDLNHLYLAFQLTYFPKSVDRLVILMPVKKIQGNLQWLLVLVGTTSTVNDLLLSTDYIIRYILKICTYHGQGTFHIGFIENRM